MAHHFAGSLPFSLVKYTSSDIETGQTLAHELAHNLGIGHDFQVMKGRSLGTCGPGTYAPGGALMNYGRPLGKTWSDCSREDFQNHFNQQQPFCLKTSKQDSLVRIIKVIITLLYHFLKDLHAVWVVRQEETQEKDQLIQEKPI